MRTTYSAILVMMLSFVLVVSGCGGGSLATQQPGDSANDAAAENPTDNNKAEGTEEQENNEADNEPAAHADVSGEITVWAFTDKVFQEIGSAFMKEYPNVKVKTVVMDFGQMHDKLQTTLAAGSGAPDVAEVEQGQFPRYVTGGVLEDLLIPPYNAGQYKSDVPRYNWERWFSPDGMKLLGMPWDITPGVYYYRADIFEELGLPSDPDELGEYIQDPENWMAVAQTLKASGKYIMEWGDGPVHWAGDEVGYFDDQLGWLRNNDKMAQFLDITKRGEQMKWAPYQGFGSDKGKQLVKKGELVGLILGSWGGREIERNFPELKGKWRVTRLPMGLNVGMGGSSFVLPSQSKNKKAAWAYIEWCMRSENAWKIWTKPEYSIQPGWNPIYKLPWYEEQASEYLGGQQPYKLYNQLVEAIPVRRLTPLDGKAWPIWLEGVQNAIKKNLDSKATLQKIQEDIESKLKVDKEKLWKQMGR